MTALFLGDWAQGRAVYGLVTAYHVYLEFPLLAALVVGSAAPARGPAAASAA